MGMYDNYDPEMANKSAMAMFVFLLVLVLIMVGANLFGFATIGWGWVFAPIWIPMALGLILTVLGIRPPGQ